MKALPNRNCINCLKELEEIDEVVISTNDKPSGLVFCSIKCIRDFLNDNPHFEYKNRG